MIIRIGLYIIFLVLVAFLANFKKLGKFGSKGIPVHDLGSHIFFMLLLLLLLLLLLTSFIVYFIMLLLLSF